MTWWQHGDQKRFKLNWRCSLLCKSLWTSLWRWNRIKIGSDGFKPSRSTMWPIFSHCVTIFLIPLEPFSNFPSVVKHKLVYFASWACVNMNCPSFSFGLSSVLAFCFMMIAASWGELHTITHSFEIQPTLVLWQYRPTTCRIPIRCRWNALVSISYKFKLVSMSGQPLLFFSPLGHRTIKCLSQVLPLRPPPKHPPPFKPQ